jgi:hypothetical protein
VEHLEKELEQLIGIATRIVSEGRAPTDEERTVFLDLRRKLEGVEPTWRVRLINQIDHFSAALEGMGI